MAENLGLHEPQVCEGYEIRLGQIRRCVCRGWGGGGGSIGSRLSLFRERE